MVADNELPGGQVLRQVRDAYAQHRQSIAQQNKRVVIVRFEADASAPVDWRRRMEASRISAEQKVRAFTYLGYTPEHLVLPATVSDSQFAAIINRGNADPRVTGIIVQFPPPDRLSEFVQDITPSKDLDALLASGSPYPACATADGVARLIAPFSADATIAVVGARGFVGQGVVRLLRQHGHEPMQLDAGDDLRDVHQADVVVSATGCPGVLGSEHLRPHHRMVIDTGFVPHDDGRVLGDLRPESRGIPQHVTPVPGGVGPIEMAVLMERLVRKDIDTDLPSWRLPNMPYVTREHFDPATPGQRSGALAALRLSFPVPIQHSLRQPRPPSPSHRPGSATHQNPSREDRGPHR